MIFVNTEEIELSENHEYTSVSFCISEVSFNADLNLLDCRYCCL